MFWIAGALAFAGIFLRLTWELTTSEDLSTFDTASIRLVEGMRVTSMNGAAVDFTALGSVTLGVLISGVAITLMLLARDRAGALHLALAGLGSAVWTQVFKGIVNRPRPTIVSRLVEVDGLSYPSGHSLSAAAIYLTLAILATRHFKNWGARLVILLIAVTVILGVGFSRVYLGVHYPSDTLSGMSLGAAWALILAGLFSRGYWRE